MSRPPRPRTPSRAGIPQPPRKTQRPGKLKFLNAPVNYTEGPGNAPAEFRTGTTSIPEYYVWWALNKILGPPEIGKWEYQATVLGGRHRPGGAKPDFIVYDRNPSLVIRVQGVFFHLQSGQQKLNGDDEQFRDLQRIGYQVIDVYDSQFIKDTSGRTVLKVVRDALQGKQWPSPNLIGH